MKRLKRWLALILVVVLVALNGVHSMTSALIANELDIKSADSAVMVDDADVSLADTSGTEGVEVEVIQEPQPEVVPNPIVETPLEEAPVIEVLPVPQANVQQEDVDKKTDVSYDSYTVTYQMEDSLREGYVYNNGSPEDPKQLKKEKFGYAFGVFLKQKLMNVYIFAVQMVVLEDVTGRVVKDDKLTDETVEFKAGEVVSYMDGKNAKAVKKLAYAQFPEDKGLKLEVRAIKHQVTFVGDGGKVIDTQTVIDGTSARAPGEEQLKVEHKEFTGWDADFSEVKSDLTVTAQYKFTEYKVNYYLDESLQGDYILSKGGTGTYTDWKKPTDRITAFGIWLRTKGDKPSDDRRVTMVMRDSATGKTDTGVPVTIEAGRIVSKLEGQDAKVIFGVGSLGHTFFDAGDEVHIIVKAAVPDKKIDFETNGGTTVESMEGFEGEATGLLAWPNTTLKGYSVEGWYADAEFTKKVENYPTVYPTQSTTYYAKWKRDILNDTFGVNDYVEYYDGEPHSVTFTGKESLLAGETVEFSKSGTDGWSEKPPQYTDVADSNGEIGVTVYARVLSGGEVIWNGSGTVKIKKRPIAITVGNYEKEYRSEEPIFEGTVEGWLEKDGAFEYLLKRKPGENVGKYDINAVTVDMLNENYETPQVVGDGKLTIIPKQVTLIPINAEKVYGNSDAAFGYEVVDRENKKDASAKKELSYSVSAIPNQGETEVKNVGNYVLKATEVKKNNNYQVTVTDGTYSITKRPVTLTANSISKKYGQPDADFFVEDTAKGFGAVITSGNVIALDELEYTAVRTEVNQGEDVKEGGYQIDIIVDAEKNPNYAIKTKVGKLTILPVDVEVVIAADSIEKVYGDREKALTAKVYGAEASEVKYKVVREKGKNAGTYTIKIELGDNPNYKNIAVENGTYTITPRPIQIAIGDTAKTYGQKDPVDTYKVKERNLVEGDKSPTYTFTRQQGVNVGEYDIFAAIDTTVKKNSSNINYVIDTQEEGTLTIKKATATIAAADATKIYGEKDADSLTEVTYSGLTNGDIGLNYTLRREKGENSGKYAIVIEMGENRNYKVDTIDAELTITKKDITVTANPQSKTYGEADPEDLTATVDKAALVMKDKDTDIKYGIKRADDGEDVAVTHEIYVIPRENDNYTIIPIAGTMEINKRDVTVTVKDAEKIYGSDDPDYTANVMKRNVIDGDKLDYIINRDAGEEVGTYDIIVDVGENPNYKVQTENGKLTILGQVFYDANGGNGEVIDEAAYARDTDITVKGQDNLTRDGAEFIGWSPQQYELVETQEEQDAAKTTIVSTIPMGEKSVTLYAVWEQDNRNPVVTPITPSTPPTPATLPTPAAPDVPIEPTTATIIQTITQPLTALADSISAAVNDNVQELIPVDEEGVPLANKANENHRCCVLHILLLLLALFVEIAYTRSVKRRQQRLFELRKEITLLERESQRKKEGKKGIA